MSWLLDTDACIAIINGSPQGARRRLRSTLTRGQSVAVSAIALFELWYGVAKSARAAANTPLRKESRPGFSLAQRLFFKGLMEGVLQG